MAIVGWSVKGEEGKVRECHTSEVLIAPVDNKE